MGSLQGKRQHQDDADAGAHEASCKAPRLALPQFETQEASPRFESWDEAAHDYFRSNGYVVIASALSEDEVSAALDLFWQFVEASSAGEIQRDAPETWGHDRWGGNSQNGIFEGDGVGQSAFLWYVRTRPNVLQAFQRLWSLAEPEDLVMSFDGCCAFRPTARDASWRTMGGWWHTDQNGATTGSELHCVQGFVSLLEAGAQTGGFAVLPRSHIRHAELFEQWQSKTCKRMRDFCILPHEEPILEGPLSIRPRLVASRPGDLVLWDSRVIHCNVPAWHRFDEEPLGEALAAAGLADLHESEPVLSHCRSKADAVWFWHNHIAERQEVVDSRLAKFFRGLAQELTAELQVPVAAGSVEMLQRLVAYVCACPRERVPRRALREKRRGVLLGATATHWPDRAEFKSVAEPGSPAVVDAFKLSPLALQILGCDGPDADAMRTQLQYEANGIRRG